jgi:O-antigen/teichoic acid export membrane protein
VSDRRRQTFAFVRLLGGAVSSQALLSAASFAISLILIRATSDPQYGYYILATNAILLVVSLQNAFFSPPLSIRLHKLDLLGRGQLVGGLYREQRRIVPAGGVLATAVALALWYAGILNSHTGPLALATIAAALAILHREYFRIVLYAHRRPYDVLRTDLVYVVLMVAGVVAAAWMPEPAVVALATLGVAALASGIMLSKTLHRHEPWITEGKRGILREIAPLAAWSTAGAAIHWTFSQGYIYLVVGMLDVSAVAAIAAMRLLMMPINLLSTGIASLMLPVTAGWLHQYGTAVVWRRLGILATGLAAVTVCYFGILWALREWIFAVLLKRTFAQGDTLLLLWGTIFLVMVVRNQLAHLLAASGRFRDLTSLTFACALLSLAASYGFMLKLGVSGALVGVLIGELVSLIGVVILSLRKGSYPVTAYA